MAKLCTIKGCFKQHIAKGFCINHYVQFAYDSTYQPWNPRIPWQDKIIPGWEKGDFEQLMKERAKERRF